METTKPRWFLACGLFFSLLGCADKKEVATSTSDQPVPPMPASKPIDTAPPAELKLGELVGEKNGIRVSKLDGSPKFPDARLFLRKPAFGTRVEPKSTFAFEVKGYELGAQTAPDPFLANSAQGQHIHVIVDNGPYLAKYQPSFELELEKGSHVILAFLSRSYHESVKHDYTLTRVHVGEKTEAIEELSLDSAPHLFYSRPKGEYVGEDTRRILLDFFLANTSIGEEGNKVEATVGGETFVLTDWVPYVVEGLPMGEVEIRLRLVDAEGKLVPGPFNEVERTVTLREEQG